MGYAPPGWTDLTDQELDGVATTVTIDRATASRLGITPTTIDNTLYDAFGQRQINTLYTQVNQYHVILEVDPAAKIDPAAFGQLYVKSSTGEMVPLSEFPALIRRILAIRETVEKFENKAESPTGTAES